MPTPVRMLLLAALCHQRGVEITDGLVELLITLVLKVNTRAERRVELAMEENRYFDLRRWSKPADDLSKTDRWVTAMEITRNADGSFTYARRPVRATERKNYTNKFLWVPIPLNEANRLRSITGADWQNAGW